MKEIREEAERHKKAKLEKYGADHKACGGSMKKYAHGGKVHDDKAEDEALIKKEVKPEALKHRADGGPIGAGGPSPRLGRGRKGGKGKTQVNVMVAPKSGGDAPALPPALGAGSGGPSALPPKPMPPMPPPNAGPAGPMKRGGAVHKKEHEKKHEGKHHEKHHGHSGHRH